MRKQTKSSMTRKLDKRMSDIVRSLGYCQRCGPHVPQRYEILQCAHIYSRTYRSVRWERQNLLCLCAGCHFYFHRNPLEFGEWVQNYLGAKYVILKAQATAIKKWTVPEMVEYYEALG